MSAPPLPPSTGVPTSLPGRPALPGGWILPAIGLVAFSIVLAGVLLIFVTGAAHPPLENGAGFAFWPVFPIAWLLLIVLAFVAFRWTRWGRGRGGCDRAGDWGGAREAARLRYAQGEITRDQLSQLLSDLDRTD